MENIQDTTRAQAGPQRNGDRFFAQIPLPRGEQLVIALSQYKNNTYVALRVWYPGDDGRLKPSAKGANVKVEHLPAIAHGIARALDAARADGLVD